MGFLRLALAVIVLWGHTIPANYNVLSIAGVETFFIISGFYMELIKDKYSSTLNFYKSRFIRIFALYYFVLVLTILFRYFFYEGAHLFHGGALQIFITVFQNIFIFGQDFLRGLTFFDGEIHLNKSNIEGAFPLYNAYLGQAWSIATELTFYLSVPFLLHLRTKYIIAIMLPSMWLRFQMMPNFIPLLDNWNCLFPAELCFFLIGSLGCRFYKSHHHEYFFSYFKKNFSPFWIYFLMVIFFAFLFAQPLDIIRIDGIKSKLSLPIYPPLFFAFFIPILFHFFKNDSLDKRLGELSYGVYIWHLLITEILLRTGLEKNNPYYLFSILTLAITLICAALTEHFIEAKVDRYRHKGLKKSY